MSIFGEIPFDYNMMAWSDPEWAFPANELNRWPTCLVHCRDEERNNPSETDSRVTGCSHGGIM
jgi:hypothetical protein